MVAGRMEVASADLPHLHAKGYAPQKILAILAVMAEQGVAADEVLKGTGIGPLQAQDASTRISIQQFLLACGNADRLARDPTWALHVGRRLRLTSFGMYGYALLCSTTLRQACDFAVRYHRLATPVMTIAWQETTRMFEWVFPNSGLIGGRTIDPDQWRCLLEMQMAIHVGLTRDVMGPACVPVKARMAIKAPSHAAATSRFLECPVDFGRKQNRLVYRAEWLDKAPQLANSITVVEVSAACGKLLQEFQWTGGFTQRVYQELTRFPGRFPLIDSVASALQMNARTLRRRLADEGTSYRAVLEGVRRTLAIEYLRNSAMNSDDIASALGFSDSASFRHTFRRWTGKSPTRFRDEPFR